MRSEENASTPRKSLFHILSGVALFLSIIAIAISIVNFYCMKNNKISTRVLSSATQQETISLQTLQKKLDALQKTQEAQAQNVLRETPNANTQKTFSDLTILGQQIQQLSSVPAQLMLPVKNKIEINTLNNQPLNWHQKILAKFKSLKNLFVIRSTDQANTPFISIAQENRVKQNILMQLNIAQWALLQHDLVVYQTALNTISRWISQYFSVSDERKVIVDQLNTLMTISITVSIPESSSTVPAVTSSSAKTPIQLNTSTPKPSNPKLDNMPSSVET